MSGGDGGGHDRGQTGLLVALPAEAFARWPDGVRVDDGPPLAKKAELHVTLLNRADAARLAAHPRADTLRARLAASGLLDARAWLGGLGDEAWHLVENNPLGAVDALGAIDARGARADTVAVPIAHPEARAWFEALRAAGLDVATPPLHVTVWMRGTARGIGVPDAAALARYRRATGPLTALVADPGDPQEASPWFPGGAHPGYPRP